MRSSKWPVLLTGLLALGFVGAAAMVTQEDFIALQDRVKLLEDEQRWLKAQVKLLSKGLAQMRQEITKIGTPPRQGAPQAARQPHAAGKKPTIWDGFRGISWGTDLSQRPDMGQIEAPKIPTDSGVWTREGDKLQIGEAELTEIYYITYKTRLMGILVKCRGRENFQALKRALSAQYGPLSQPNEFIEQFIKSGITSTREKVIMSLDYNEFSETGIWVVSFKPLCDQQERDKEVAARAAGKDF